MGDALAVALLEARGFTADDFARSHPAGSLGRRLLLHISDVMHAGEEVPKVRETARLSEALVEMSRKRLGMTAVVDADGRLLGLFTDGDLRRTLDDDRADLSLGTFDHVPNHLRTEFLLEDRLFCVFRHDHPIARRGARFDIDAVLSYPHLIVSATGDRTAIFDDLLRSRGLARRSQMTVTNFTAVPQLLNASDMIGVFTKLAADEFQKSAGLASRAVPIDVGGIATTMVWHNRYDRDRKHLWLREQVKTVYGAL